MQAIADAFGFKQQYLYELWKKFENEGVVGLISRDWGAAPRKLTSETEAGIIRVKALNPKRADGDIAAEFKVAKITVYRVLKDHGIQNPHRDS